VKRPDDDGPSFRTDRGAWIHGGSSHPEWAERLRLVDPMKFMNKRERQMFARLPERFTVYRAEQPDKPGGLSWTLSRKYAQELAEMFTKAGQFRRVVSREVSKSEVFARLSGREKEVLILDTSASLNVTRGEGR
jgi:hypothetical protein